MFDPSEFADSLALGADGIWYAADREVVSYPVDGNEACLQIEEDSFWFSHRNACIEAAVRRYPPKGRGAIFDIGGGNGFVSLGLMRAGFDAVLVEPGPAGAANGKKRGVPTVICATTGSAGFRRASLPAIGLFDVIEHVEDDLGFVGSMRDLLRPGGRLYATVPAYPALWSLVDVQAGHFRRYTRASIGALCERAGFRIDYASYFFRPLPFPIFLSRALPYRLGLRSAAETRRAAARDHRPSQGGATGLMSKLLASEVGNIAAGERMAFGGSCLLVASAV